MTAAEPKTLHIWMPDQRSLCDRRARVAMPVDDPEAEAEAIAGEKAAPVCSACILIAGNIRYKACQLLVGRNGLYPETPTRGYEALRGTRWDLVLDLDGHLETPDLDRLIDFDALMYAIDEKKLRAEALEEPES